MLLPPSEMRAITLLAFVVASFVAKLTNGTETKVLKNEVTRASGGQESRAVCQGIALELRFDCYPETPPTRETCEARGCCYDDSFQKKKSNSANSLGLPVCFFPSDYVSYHFTSLYVAPMGITGTLSRLSDSGFPDDIKELKIEFLYETDTRIRIRIYDPNNPDRHEPEFPVVPEASSPAQYPIYRVVTDESQGTFAILRGAEDIAVFDTRGAGPLIFSDQFLQLSSLLTTSYIYGLGQHLDGLLLDTSWHRRFLWNYDTGPKPLVNLYGSHPFYLNFGPTGKAHGVFLLNSNAIDVILQPTPAITFRPLGGILDLYVFLGPTPSDVIQQYTDVIGKPFLPPYWSLGYHQCRYNYYTTNRTREIWQQTIDAGIPFDVQWNDIDSMHVFKDFTVDPVNYIGLAEFVDDIHAANMHYILITDPALDADDPPGSYFPYDNGTAEGIFILDASGNEFIGKTWIKDNSVWPDFTNPRAHELWEEYLRMFREEIEYDGIWLDMNEPSTFDTLEEVCNATNPLNSPPYLPPNSEQSDKWLYYRTVCMDARQKSGLHYDLHNLYGVLETVATSNAVKNVRQKRPFIISRSSFPGHGKYGGHWTGDTSSDWYQLYLSISDIINFNLFGVPMVGADICGFGENTTVPLCTAWYQVGAFYPFARNHNSEFCIDQDPVSLGPAVVESAKEALTLRYLLLPYLYSLFFRAHLTGEPLFKPLFFDFSGDKQTYTIDSEFLWGEALLFTPILLPDTVSVNSYFPAGRWYHWYSGALLSNSTFGQYIDITHVPYYPNIFARGGHVVPTQVPEVTTVQSRLNNFMLEVFLDDNGEASGELYWDDGESIDTYELGLYNHIWFSVSGNALENSVRHLGYGGGMQLGQIRVSGVETFRSCVMQGQPYQCTYDSDNKVLIFPDIVTVSLEELFTCHWE